MQTAGLEPVLVEVTLRYHESARMDQIIHIDVSCARVGKASFDLAFEARIQDPKIGSLSEAVATSATIT